MVSMPSFAILFATDESAPASRHRPEPEQTVLTLQIRPVVDSFVSTELSVLLPVYGYDFIRLTRPRWPYEGSVACDTDLHSRCSLYVMSSPPGRHDFAYRYPSQHYTASSLRNQFPQSMSVDATSSETRLSTVSPFNMPSGCTTKRPFPAQDLFSRNLYLGWPLSKVWMVAGCA